MGDERKKPARAQAPAVTWTMVLLWLDAERRRIKASDRSSDACKLPRVESHAMDLLVIAKLVRLIEIVQALGRRFVDLLKKNEELLKTLDHATVSATAIAESAGDADATGEDPTDD